MSHQPQRRAARRAAGVTLLGLLLVVGGCKVHCFIGDPVFDGEGRRRCECVTPHIQRGNVCVHRGFVDCCECLHTKGCLAAPPGDGAEVGSTEPGSSPEAERCIAAFLDAELPEESTATASCTAATCLAQCVDWQRHNH